MADLGSIIVATTFFIIYGIFLFYDWFRPGEKWGFLAYVTAVLPADTLWFMGFDVLIAYTVLFMLWNVCLIRDLLFVFRKDREYDDIFLFLILGIIVHIILTAILPAPQVNPKMQQNTAPWGFFYFPDVYTATYGIQSWVDPSALLAFRLSATFMVILVIMPMIVDLKESEEHISLLALVIIDAIFILPFLWLAYVWVGGLGWPLTFLFAVVLLIILLLLTREK
ncbi:MAG: hypothetical protein EU539_08730 [Promethearchaeota archaeon]|nr:MAG: hypothetical protein EU539_08730 [Candidatus Lokiarchaeota archaeon]